MGYLLYCDVNEEGTIIDALSGANIIPSREYDYFFFTTDARVMEEVVKYKVDIANRKLVRK